MIDQYSVAFFGEDALLGGLQDCRFDIQFQLRGCKYKEFNQNINEYLTRDVIVMGRDDPLVSNENAAKIKEAVRDLGAILLTNFRSYQSLPQDMLPVTTIGECLGLYGPKLLPTDDLKRIFGVFEVVISPKWWVTHGRYRAKIGSTTWLTFEDGSPAVISWVYGKGMVLLRAFKCKHNVILPYVMLAIFD